MLSSSSISFVASLVLFAIGCAPAATSATAVPSAPAQDQSQPLASPVTVILVRHAEKATDDPRDPALSPAGEARALALANLLGQAGVTHLIATEYKRTQEMLRPLANAAGSEITVIPAANGERLVAELRALPAGAVAVVAGHSNTIPAVAHALGGDVRGTEASPSGSLIPDAAYDRLYILTLAPARPAQTLELRFGAATP